MGIAELKLSLHQIVDRIDDEKLLRVIFNFLKEHEKSGQERWESLTDEQQKEVLLAYDESENDSNLIEDKDVWKSLK